MYWCVWYVNDTSPTACDTYSHTLSLHDARPILADEPAGDLLVAALELRHLAGVAGNDLVDQSIDFAAVADLLQALRLDDGAGLRAALPHRLEDLLGDAPGDRAVGDEVEQPAQLRRVDRRRLQIGRANVRHHNNIDQL